MDCSVWELDGKHVAGLGVVRDGVEFVARSHEHHATGGLTVSEAGLLVVVQETHPLCRLREKTPALLPTLGGQTEECVQSRPWKQPAIIMHEQYQLAVCGE